MEKVKMIYQCVTFLHTVLGHSFNSLCGCPSISVRPQRKYIFGMSFPFSCMILLELFYRSSTPFLPAKRFIRLTGKSSSDMSDASSTQDLSKNILTAIIRITFIILIFRVTIQKVLPKGFPQIWR